MVTGTRAEYGILYPVLRAIQSASDLELLLVVTGMHLSHEFGYTIREIENDGFKINARVDMLPGRDTPGAMAEAVGSGIKGMATTWEKLKPDIILVIADRIEPLAAAIAGAYVNIPVAHIHGGDVSGNIDDPARHAITRFAHIHFPATEKSAERIIKMGEEPWRVHVVGPLGIYAMDNADFISKDELCKKLELDSGKPIILVVQHPVTTQADKAAAQMRETMEALVVLGEQAVVIYPNADTGGRAMIEVIKEYEKHSFIKAFKNLPYMTFVSLMKSADVMVGNSSAAIIEAPLFALPAVDIGTRQEGRERGANTISVTHQKEAIIKAAGEVLHDKNLKGRLRGAVNPYDVARNGAKKVVDILSKVSINEKLLQKKLTY